MVNQALGIVNLPWVDSALSNTLNLTHAAVGRAVVDHYSYFHLARKFWMQGRLNSGRAGRQ